MVITQKIPDDELVSQSPEYMSLLKKMTSVTDTEIERDYKNNMTVLRGDVGILMCYLEDEFFVEWLRNNNCEKVGESENLNFYLVPNGRDIGDVVADASEKILLISPEVENRADPQLCPVDVLISFFDEWAFEYCPDYVGQIFPVAKKKRKNSSMHLKNPNKPNLESMEKIKSLID